MGYFARVKGILKEDYFKNIINTYIKIKHKTGTKIINRKNKIKAQVT
jgi:hypothetical protein